MSRELAYIRPNDGHNFGDAEEQVLLQAKEQMENQQLSKRFALSTSSTWRSFLPNLPSRGMARVSPPKRRAHIICGRPDDPPRYSRESLCPYTPAMSSDLLTPSVIEGPSPYWSETVW